MNFFDDYRVTRITTQVLYCEAYENHYWITCADSCFFVESGGMVSDTGWLNGLPILKVRVVDQQVWYLVDEPLFGSVEMVIDWDARLRKVQVHTAQHLISALVEQITGGKTLSFHVNSNGNEIRFTGCTVELSIEKLQSAVNQAVIANYPVSITYPRNDDYRVVSIGDLDHNPCGCLHLNNLGEVGLIQLLSFVQTKHEITITYLAGYDMLVYWQQRYPVLQELTRVTARDHLALVEQVRAWQVNNSYLTKQLEQTQRALWLAKLKGLIIKDHNLILFPGLPMNHGSWLLQQIMDQSTPLVIISTTDEQRRYFWVGGNLAVMAFSKLQELGVQGGGKTTFNGSCAKTLIDESQLLQCLPSLNLLTIE
jgi:alanyl-tRNA synthetase